jgi:hypothetical protein
MHYTSYHIVIDLAWKRTSVLTNDFLGKVLLRVLSQLEFFYFILSQARKEPEDLPASVGGVAVLAPVATIGYPSFFL